VPVDMLVYFFAFFLVGMMAGIMEKLQWIVNHQLKLDWLTLLTEWKRNGQWHVEVY
jgi:hypothetical protein